jgi:hypothetical protein
MGSRSVDLVGTVPALGRWSGREKCFFSFNGFPVDTLEALWDGITFAFLAVRGKFTYIGTAVSGSKRSAMRDLLGPIPLPSAKLAE